MLTLVLSWLGGSVIWLVPLMVLQIAQLAMKNGVPRGQGTLRVWAGAVLAYAASCSLESLVTAGIDGWPHGGLLGRALAGGLADSIGRPWGMAVSLLALICALPLYVKGIRTRLGAVLQADDALTPISPRGPRTFDARTSGARSGLSLPTGPARGAAQRPGGRATSIPSGISSGMRPPASATASSKPRAAAPFKPTVALRPGAGRASSPSAAVPRAGHIPSSLMPKTVQHKPSPGSHPPAAPAIVNPVNNAVNRTVNSAVPGKPANSAAVSRATDRSSPAPSAHSATPDKAPGQGSFLRDLPVEPAIAPVWYEPVSTLGPAAARESVLPEQVSATLEAIARRAAEWTALSRGETALSRSETALSRRETASNRSEIAVEDAPLTVSVAAPVPGAAAAPAGFETGFDADGHPDAQAQSPTAPASMMPRTELDEVIDALAQEMDKPSARAPYIEVAEPSPGSDWVPLPDSVAGETFHTMSDDAIGAQPLDIVPAPRHLVPADRVAQPWEAAANEVMGADPVQTAPAAVPADPVLPALPRQTADADPPAVAAPAGSFTFAPPSAMDIELPPVALLARASVAAETVSEQALLEKGQLIEQRLKEFKVPVSVIGADAGPVITRFEIEPAVGVRGSQIVGLMKDLSRALGVTSVRVVETIPGKTCMGLELPNAQRQMIRLSEILESDAYRNHESYLTMAMGKDITGNPVVADLAKAPHMLVAGTTGSGKSVAINAMILSLLYKATPENVRMIMIDPKMLELSVYEGIPHLLAPVVTDMKLAAHALSWCVGEMERRYRLLSALGVRNLAGYNQKIRNAQLAETYLTNPFSLTPEAPEPLSTLPLIVVVIDELADLMMVAGKKIEELIARLAQKARAAGIHLILATQRPSVDVITGLIKANIPTRVAFQVSSKIDSRTILDQMGAESLLGQGDMLFLPPGTGYPQRVHGAFVADEEVHRVVEYLKQFGEPEYEESILAGPSDENASQDLFGDTPDVEADPLYDEAVAFVLRSRRASISSVQRQFRIGYNRAARLVEQMESAGLVSAMSNGGSREVLVPGPAD